VGRAYRLRYRVTSTGRKRAVHTSPVPARAEAPFGMCVNGRRNTASCGISAPLGQAYETAMSTRSTLVWTGGRILEFSEV
jgi:hypothetical protein